MSSDLEGASAPTYLSTVWILVGSLYLIAEEVRRRELRKNGGVLFHNYQRPYGTKMYNQCHNKLHFQVMVF